MDKYILDILKEVNMIIIPGLGALSITDATSGEILFMPYLSHDDKTLAKYMAEKDGIEETEASNRIAKYVREIKHILDQGETYDMYRFGSFSKSGDDITFQSWEESSNNAVTTDSPSPLPSDTETTEKRSSEAESEEADSEISEVAPHQDNSAEKEAKEVPLGEEQPSITPVKEMNILQKEEYSKTNERFEQLKEKKNNPSKKKKRGVGFYLLIIFAVLILGVSGVTIFNYEAVEKYLPFLASNESQATSNDELDKMKALLEGETVKEETSPIESDTTETEAEIEPIEPTMPQEEELPTVDSEIEQKSTTTESLSGTDLRFHLIAGAFASEDNANRLADEMRSRGYTVRIGKGNGLNLVSIKSFNTRAEAIQAQSSVRADAPSAWVYEWK